MSLAANTHHSWGGGWGTSSSKGAEVGHQSRQRHPHYHFCSVYRLYYLLPRTVCKMHQVNSISFKCVSCHKWKNQYHLPGD